MNIHPLFGQFPVSILIMYALLELFGRQPMRESDFWFRVRALLVITGTVAAYLTMPTGGATKETILLARPGFADLIATHTAFAWMATIAFSILAVAYGVRLAKMYQYDTGPFFQKPEVIRLWKPITKAADAVRRPVLSRILSLIGIVTLFIAMGLNAALIYGPTIDPIVGFIYNTFLGLFY